MRRWCALSRPQVAALLDAPAHRPGDGPAVDLALDAFDAWAADLATAQPGSEVVLGLSSRWLLLMVVPEHLPDSDGGTSAAAEHPDAALDLAQQQWAHYFELDADAFDTQWHTTVVWQGAVRLVCAMPRALADGLEQLARAHGLRLQALMPWWALGLQQALASADSEPETEGPLVHWQWREGPDAQAWVTQAVAQRGARGARLTDVSQGPGTAWPEPAVGAPPLLRAAWPAAPASNALGQGSTPSLVRTCPEAAAWLAAQPEGWAEALNRTGPRVRTGFWGWALLALGVVLMLHVADEATEVQAAQADAQATLQRLQRGERQLALADQARARAVSRPTEGSGAAAPVLQGEGWRHAAQLALWLGHPWMATLDALDEQSWRSGVVLSRFSLDLATLGQGPGAQPEAQLQAAVRDDAQALQWLQALGPEVSLRTREPLAQPFTTPRGTYGLRIDAVRRQGLP